MAREGEQTGQVKARVQGRELEFGDNAKCDQCVLHGAAHDESQVRNPVPLSDMQLRR